VRATTCAAAIAAILATAPAAAAPPRDASLATLRAGKLGLFIHYGPSTLLNAPTATDWMEGV